MLPGSCMVGWVSAQVLALCPSLRTPLPPFPCSEQSCELPGPGMLIPLDALSGRSEFC